MRMGYATKQQAQKAARNALAIVNARCPSHRNDPWTLDVWENIGWHWNIRTKHLVLWQPSKGVWLIGCSREPGEVGTETQFHLGHSFTDPAEAVEHQIQRIKQVIAKDTKLLNSILGSY